jgi:hypothetical protein
MANKYEDLWGTLEVSLLNRIKEVADQHYWEDRGINNSEDDEIATLSDVIDVMRDMEERYGEPEEAKTDTGC